MSNKYRTKQTDYTYLFVSSSNSIQITNEATTTFMNRNKVKLIQVEICHGLWLIIQDKFVQSYKHQIGYLCC